MGVTWLLTLLQVPVVSYTTFSLSPTKGYLFFCGPIRQIAPSRDFLGIAPYEVRTFLDVASNAAIAQPT